MIRQHCGITLYTYFRIRTEPREASVQMHSHLATGMYGGLTAQEAYHSIVPDNWRI